jgi:hypothetical protein
VHVDPPRKWPRNLRGSDNQSFTQAKIESNIALWNGCSVFIFLELTLFLRADTADNTARRSALMLREICYLVLATREADPSEADTEQREGNGFGNWGWI